SAAPTVGDPGVGNAYDAATTSGRSPSPLLETGRPFTLSDRCSTAGMAYRLNQGFGWYSRTPLNASSDRWSVSFTTPALVLTNRRLRRYGRGSGEEQRGTADENAHR